MNEKKGKQSIKFGNPPYILGAAAVAGPKEIDGPMARYFDRVSEDATFGKIPGRKARVRWCVRR